MIWYCGGSIEQGTRKVKHFKVTHRYNHDLASGSVLRAAYGYAGVSSSERVRLRSNGSGTYRVTPIQETTVSSDPVKRQKRVDNFSPPISLH